MMPIKYRCLSTWLCLFGLFLGHQLMAQRPTQPDGQVSAILSVKNQEIEVGRPFEVQLEVFHPEEMVVVLPDTGMDFSPFELNFRMPEPTKTAEAESKEFVIYSMYTWQIDSIQYLRLPIRYIQGKDTFLTYSNTLPFTFVPTLPTYNDSLKVKINSELAVIEEPVNWWLKLGIILVLIIILGAAALFLYRPVRKFFLRQRIEREWKKHFKRLEKVPSLLPNQENYLLELAKVWKDYLDKRKVFGLRALSSRELAQSLPDMDSLNAENRKLVLNLNREVDRVTYSGQKISDTKLDHFYGEIKSIMENEYKRRKEAAEL